jgi:hypothetical protein
MNVTLLLVALVVFAFVFGQLLNRLVARHISLSGAEYLLVGALVGPHIPPRLMTADSLSQLVPVMNLLLGLVGFLVGLRARQSFNGWRGVAVGLSTSTVTCAVVALATASLAAMLLPADGPLVLDRQIFAGDGWVVELYAARSHILLGLAVGVVATVSSSGILLGLGESLKLKSAAFALLRSSAAVSQLFAVITMGAVLALSREPPSLPVEGFGRWIWLIAALVLGLICGVCFTLFIGKEEGQSRIFLATVGTVTFAAGTGAALEVSPLLVNLIGGLTVSMLSAHAPVLLKELDRLQHPIFVLLLILAGAYWTPVTGASWLFPLIYLAVRFACVWTSTGFFANLFARDVLATRLGAGLIVQGTLAVSVAVDYALASSQNGGVVLTAALIGTLAFDMAGASGVRRLLVDAEGTKLSLTGTRAHAPHKGAEAGL